MLHYFRLFKLFLGFSNRGLQNQPQLERVLLFVQRLRIAVLFVGVAVMVGIAGYMIIDNFTFFDAYYMTIITLASVGFGEVQPLSTAGRLFTTFLILFNLGLFTYAVSTISSVLVEALGPSL